MAIKAKKVEEKGFTISIKDALEEWVGQKIENWNEFQTQALEEMAQIIHEGYHKHDFKSDQKHLIEFYVVAVAVSLIKTMDCAEPIVNGGTWDSTSTVH